MAVKKKRKVFIILGIIAAAIILFLMVVFICHKILLSREAELRTPLGELVDVDNECGGI